MKRLIIVIVVLGLTLSCTDFVTVRGPVIDKHYAPPGGGLLGAPEKWSTFIKTDTGVFRVNGYTIYYAVEIGDVLEYTFDKNQNSHKTTYRKIGK